MSLTALTDRVHFDEAIPPGRKRCLLMSVSSLLEDAHGLVASLPGHYRHPRIVDVAPVSVLPRTTSEDPYGESHKMEYT